MIKPNISISDYTYHLPDERIAKYPLSNRDASKLLIYKNKEIREDLFKNITEELPSKALLAFNNTKVIRARLRFQKLTGAQIEIFCLEPLSPAEVQMAFDSRTATSWKCIVGNARKWKNEPLSQSFTIDNQTILLQIEKGERLGDAYSIRFSWDNPQISFAEIIEHIGLTPIPPYLNRETEDIDKDRYQTVYSEHQGSVAAPTAGLHFTEDILKMLTNNGHSLLNVTLHVGAGTFKPVKSEEIAGHEMHTEHFVIERNALERLIANKQQLIAVGTTSVRTLESLYWYGVRLLTGHSINNGIEQWDPYNLSAKHTTKEALTALLEYMNNNNLTYLAGKTAIIIVPGYHFKLINGLVTNFHQPQSTLLLLIGAIVGNKWRDIYNYALNNDFRFLSYGDSSLLMIEQE
ncbi:S-adenosylmethionine:tRNA ribosyltransferase-isomerase [Carboxylicivirga mesophila]|uniref:S-adenosylmethionine:tRNA ribosyltransferase-isomerase n=1 Tax=Carboxylicivirga mesophila TaxID=1166478 RepID=A0ABS5KBR7_9BACT|nr:S-adenosylmethionine:tRNA ribosyltransferase-isomerase [Carboxylicivirga mesophila]MBS2212381.1 S-adenosylmethionine:tRNA ribosyltransferase-isomerase [Carboxylicivirga mesophila]